LGPCNASCAPTTQDINNLFKVSHARDGALLDKLNIFRFLSDLNQFKGNLKIRCNSDYFSKMYKNWGRPCNASCAPTSPDMKNPFKVVHAWDGALVGKLNIFCLWSNLTQFNSNLKTSYNSNFLSKKCKNGGGWGHCNVSDVPTIEDMNYPL